MSYNTDRLLRATFLLASVGVTVDGMDLARHNPAKAASVVNRCLHSHTNTSLVNARYCA